MQKEKADRILWQHLAWKADSENRLDQWRGARALECATNDDPTLLESLGEFLRTSLI